MNRTTTLIAAGLLVAGTLTGCAAAPTAVRAPVTVTTTRTAPPATATATETETAPPVTRTVAETATPAACAAALDDAEAIIGGENDANEAFVDAIQLLADGSTASATVKVTAGTDSITKATERLKKYAAHRNTCLGSAS